MPSGENPTVVSWFDRMRLAGLISLMREKPGQQEGLDALKAKIERARIIKPEEVPPSLVTMNSEVILSDLDTGERVTLEVVFPAAADPTTGQVSILSPIGLALFGRSEGAEVEWPVAGGTRRLRLNKVSFQPEAAGIYNL